MSDFCKHWWRGSGCDDCAKEYAAHLLTAACGLARRCERARGPNYNLDCAIWDSVYPGERQTRFEKLTAKGQPYHGRLSPADVDGYVPPMRSFTASLDAAMTLVPEGCDCVYYVCDPSGTSWKVGRLSGGVVSILGESATGGLVALALCAAALRARWAMRGEEAA